MGRLAAHVLGYVDVDSRGLAGIEKYLDEQGRALHRLACRSRSATRRHRLRCRSMSASSMRSADELARAITKFRAVAGGGVVLDVSTGEVLAAVSLPDFNPNAPDAAQDKVRMNRMTGGVFELGLGQGGDLRDGARFRRDRLSRPATMAAFRWCRARSRINDFHATRRILTVREIFTHSSNIGTAKMALDVGIEAHQAFLRRVGLFDRLRTELPEAAAPLLPAHGAAFTR